MKQTTITSLADVTKATQWVAQWLAKGLASGKAVVITLKHENRTEAQNRHLWPLLTCFAKQKRVRRKAKKQ